MTARPPSNGADGPGEGEGAGRSTVSMEGSGCIDFLRWALPRTGMRWKGFRKVRRQVCRLIRDRIDELEMEGFDAYRTHLDATPAEWAHLSTLCRVTISRFGRDRGVFRFLEEEVLPNLAHERSRVRIWSAGCASGEEPYTVAILWHLGVAPRFPGTELSILATDVDPVVLSRARRGVYPRSTLRELSSELVERAFEPVAEGFRLRTPIRRGVEFRKADLRGAPPDESFDLILCRNLAFTYFDEEEQARILAGLLERLPPGGVLVLGAHEALPPGEWPLERWSRSEPIYRVPEARA